MIDIHVMDIMMAIDVDHLDTRLLLAIDAIERCGSLTGAGDAIGLSQPALSHALNRLRALFGDPLFVRTSRGMQPTPRGSMLAVSARRILTLMRAELASVAPFDPATMKRRLTLVMSDVGEMVFLPRLLARVRQDAPLATVQTYSMLPRRLIEALDDGTVDLAIGYYPDLADSALDRQPVFDRGYLCLLATDHPRLGRSAMTLEEFLRESHVVVNSESGSEQVFERHLRDLGLQRRVVLSTPHMFSVPAIVRASDLIATVPHSVGESLAGDSRLQVVEPPLDTPRILVAQYWSRRFDQDQASRWLREVVRKAFA